MKARNLQILKENDIPVPKFEIIKWQDRNKKVDTKKYSGKYAIRSSSNVEDGILDSSQKK